MRRRCRCSSRSAASSRCSPGAGTLVDAYRLEDAERAIVCLGSTAGTVKDVVDALRDEGEPVGLLQIHSFRPFPAAAIRERSRASRRMRTRPAESPGGAAPLYAELAAALYGNGPGSRASCTASAAATSTRPTCARSSPGAPPTTSG